ncbi:hypothetical protein BST61_g6686 [Cercospora zeina]
MWKWGVLEERLLQHAEAADRVMVIRLHARGDEWQVIAVHKCARGSGRAWPQRDHSPVLGRSCKPKPNPRAPFISQLADRAVWLHQQHALAFRPFPHHHPPQHPPASPRVAGRGSGRGRIPLSPGRTLSLTTHAS